MCTNAISLFNIAMKQASDDQLTNHTVSPHHTRSSVQHLYIKTRYSISWNICVPPSGPESWLSLVIYIYFFFALEHEPTSPAFHTSNQKYPWKPLIEKAPASCESKSSSTYCRIPMYQTIRSASTR